jgi:L-glutamine:2-deoxy-scyllo-inosose/3-amino-2,3-dideoxy-scyllo-inosose aminotransferase
VGTFGDIGAFSFQQGKVLAAGEGGAAITNNADLYLRMQELRADGRSYSKSIAPSGEEISATGGISGANFCMTEVSAAILLDQLPKLDDQHRIRASAVSALIDTVDSSIHISTAPLPGSADQCSIYELALTINPIEFGLQSSAEVASKITEVLGFPVWAPDVPLSEDPLYRPDTNPLYRHAAAGKVWNLVEYPGVKAYRQNTLLLHHAALLAGEAGGRRIGEAINTVARRSKGGNS